MEDCLVQYRTASNCIVVQFALASAQLNLCGTVIQVLAERLLTCKMN